MKALKCPRCRRPAREFECPHCDHIYSGPIKHDDGFGNQDCPACEYALVCHECACPEDRGPDVPFLRERCVCNHTRYSHFVNTKRCSVRRCSCQSFEPAQLPLLDVPGPADGYHSVWSDTSGRISRGPDLWRPNDD